MARFGFGQVAEREWLSDFFEHHRAHGDVLTGIRRMAIGEVFPESLRR